MEFVFSRVRFLAKVKASNPRSPKPDKVRHLVFDIFSEVLHRDGYSNLLLPNALATSDFAQRDKGFATELLYGTLRMMGRHDFLISQVIDRPLDEVDKGALDLLRLGAHQLFEMRVADHAAVSETVELARKVIGESKASYINAVLRALSKKTLDQWLVPVHAISDEVTRLSILYSHPEWIISAYYDLLKEPRLVERELAANNQPASPTFVAWPGESTQREFIDRGGQATRFSPFGARLDIPPASLDLVRNRKAGVQDEGSQLVAYLFAEATQSAATVLDLCAGPGGKAALLSRLVRARGGEFFANEISEARATLVRKSTGLQNVWVGDGREIASHGLTFEAILADVPCTGLGALRRRPEVRWRRSIADLRALTQLQRELSEAALSSLSPGGVYGYATCSPHYAETSALTNSLLKNHPELELIDISPYLPSTLLGALRDGALSLWTGLHETDSMYLSLFRKKVEV